jgi:hypothetical protein
MEILRTEADLCTCAGEQFDEIALTDSDANVRVLIWFANGRQEPGERRRLVVEVSEPFRPAAAERVKAALGI